MHFVQEHKRNKFSSIHGMSLHNLAMEGIGKSYRSKECFARGLCR
jgi:hypothetical protein